VLPGEREILRGSEIIQQSDQLIPHDTILHVDSLPRVPSTIETKYHRPENNDNLTKYPTVLSKIMKWRYTNQCCQRKVVKQIGKDLPNISSTIPVNQIKTFNNTGLHSFKYAGYKKK